MEVYKPRRPSRSDVENYIKTLNTSQIYIEIMDPWEMEALTPDYKEFIKDQLSDRENLNLQNLENLTYRFLGQFHVKKKKDPKTFKNYCEFREHTTKRFDNPKNKSLLALEGIDLNDCKRITKDESMRKGTEKKPALSKENLNINFYDRPDKGFLLFTGLKTMERALEKCAKRLVAAEQELKEINFPDMKTSRYITRYHTVNLARIQDIARMRFVLTEGLASGSQLGIIFKALKTEGFFTGNPHEELRKEPYNHYAFHFESPEYSPQDDVSLKIMGIPGFFKDLFGERSHPIYEARYSDKVRLPENTFMGLKRKAELDKDSKIRTLEKGDIEYAMDRGEIRKFSRYMSRVLEFLS